MKKNEKSNLGILAQTFTHKWRAEIGIEDYSTNAENAYTEVIWSRIKMMFTLGTTFATGLLIANLIIGTGSITWTMICFLGGIGMFLLSGGLWKMLWEDRDTKPGKSSVKLYKEWSILRKNLLNSGILSDREIISYDGSDRVERFFNDNLVFCADEIRRHETEGRESSRKRARARMSRIKSLADELGVKTDKFKKLFEINRAA